MSAEESQCNQRRGARVAGRRSKTYRDTVSPDVTLEGITTFSTLILRLARTRGVVLDGGWSQDAEPPA